MRRDTERFVTGLVIVLVVVLVAIPLVVLSRNSGKSGPSVPPPGPPVNASMSVGAYLGTHYANPFYAVLLSDDGLSTTKLVALGSFLNSTPITWFRFGGNGTSYDPTTGTNYIPPPGGGTYVPTSALLWNLTWFKSWCLSRTPHCLWLAFLPGEENSTSFAVHTAVWYHSVLGLAPEYWQFGNEPDGWTHFGKNLSAWSTSDSVGATSLDYATMAHEYLTAVASLYPSDRFIGLEAGCGCDSADAMATAQAVGPLVSAMAFHGFPSLPNAPDATTALLGGLTGPTNISSEATRFRSAILSGCPGCTSLPIQVGAYQGGPPSALSPLDTEYPGAPFLAASVIEALEANISMFTVFNTGSLIDLASGAVLPQGLLYQRILANMTMGDDYAVSVSAGGVGGVFSVLVRNETRESLLLVNTNLSYSLNLTIPTSVFPVGSLGSEWSWGPGTVTPIAVRGAVLPSTFFVPSEGILLLDNF